MGRERKVGGRTVEAEIAVSELGLVVQHQPYAIAVEILPEPQVLQTADVLLVPKGVLVDQCTDDATSRSYRPVCLYRQK